MKCDELKIIKIKDYRKKKQLNNNIEKDKNTTLSDGFYNDLRKQKRNEKGVLWD